MTPLPPIKKCSFVKGKPEVEQSGAYDVAAQGSFMGFIIRGPERKTERGAILAWNRKVK